MKCSKSILLLLCLLLTFVLVGYSRHQRISNKKVFYALADSLDNYQFEFPKMEELVPTTIIHVTSTEDWENISREIKRLLEQGQRNIKIEIKTKNLEYGRVANELTHLDYPDANIQIEGNGAQMIAFGDEINKKSDNAIIDKEFYSVPYSKFDSNNVLLDEKHRLIPVNEGLIQLTGPVEEWVEGGKEKFYNDQGGLIREMAKIWRLPISLPNLSIKECEDFYILLTRDWTACRHKVYKVEDGYLYFFINSKDAPTLFQRSLPGNKDFKTYHRQPRFSLINCPISNGVHTKHGSLYVPLKYKQIRVCKSLPLLTIKDCRFNSFILNNINVIGSTDKAVVVIRNSDFTNYAYISNNNFSSIAECAVNAYKSNHVIINHNTIEKTRVGAINVVRCSNVLISKNILKNIGWMLSTRAIAITGVKLLVSDNIIEDFNYSAIECGGFRQESNDTLEYIVEHNIIRYTKAYYDTYMNHTLSDAGGIYVHPENTGGIIRYNVVENIIGFGANRGIFVDDGARNVAVYGNLIAGIANSYDIDLRYTTSHKNTIPDHNTNNIIIHNIMTGGYRFQDAGPESRCFGGHNLMLRIGEYQESKIELNKREEDIELSNCLYDSCVIIPKLYLDDLKQVHIDKFVLDNIVIR